MYPVSARFLAALAESHTVVTEVVLFKTDGGVERLDHTGGSVTVDRGSAVRRTCTVTLPDPALIPRTPTDKLATYGAKLRISRGIQFNDGAIELVPLGVFRLDDAGGDVDEGPVTLSGKSLEIIVADDKFTTPYRVSGTAVTAITALILRSIPDAEIVSTATDAAIGAKTYDVEADPWVAVLELAATIGAEVYADPDGVFVIEELPDPLTAPVAWTVAAGEGGVLIKADRRMSSDGVFNGVLARGENTESNTAPVSSLVVDTDPNSPTYWSGPFGRRPAFYNSSTLITTGQCTAAASLKLRSAKAPNASADITSLPNPALAPGDVLRAVYDDGTKELHQAHSFTVPLEVGGDFPIRTISAKEDA
ncbi:DUF5047 domain-containing protein [Streptomyces sp. A3M-1-3]|uniref:DUF5047 domain-containing protein n=1 Tax=Streptomyces sp. A3M-1-3 TaxID=2962044 RepID=UPI0020B71F53|nr:DUF5047 domain-containing protein [Streptomyces sp. A3M-1-3]MCP3820058.1 DUF5047 domain-containing protein [Streptomyces sp. A3M-1-3]